MTTPKIPVFDDQGNMMQRVDELGYGQNATGYVTCPEVTLRNLQTDSAKVFYLLNATSMPPEAGATLAHRD